MLQEKAQKEMLSKKQTKNKTKMEKAADEDKPVELLQKPRDYVVKFTFPAPPPLSPPVLGAHCE